MVGIAADVAADEDVFRLRHEGAHEVLVLRVEHLLHVFAKLDVADRTRAVTRAMELGIL